MFAKKPLASAIGIASAAGALSAVMVAPVVHAAEGGQVIEEVVVTGSRIAKKDFISNAPVATIGQEQFQLTNAVNTESLLNTLPQAVPGLDRTSNNPGNGTATIDLRGLGSNRTLVLMDGKRVNPTTSNGTVDINSIPTALIQNVEVLTGGASAVYGSDAVAGVVNFIMKKDFEGVAVDAGYEITEEGDAGIFSTNFTVGGNFADGRGNVAFSLNYTDRDDLFQGDREFSNFAQFDDTDADGNLILIPGGSSGVPDTSIFAGGFGTFSPDSFGVIFGDQGSVRPFVTGGDDNDFYNYAPVNYIQLPQERYQASVFGHYAITDNVEAFGRALYTSSSVPSQLAPTPIFQTTSFTLDGSPFLSPATQQIVSDAIGEGVDTDGDGIDDTGSALLRRRLEEVGPRVSDDRFESWSIQAGFRGNAGVWDWETYVQRGQVENSGVQLGNVNRDRFNQALLLDLSDPTGGTCADPSANGSTVPCSPINIFGAGNISDEGAAFLRTAVASTALFEQTIVGANVAASEGFFSLPGGDVGVAFGYEYIDNQFDFRPSQDLAAGTIAGFNGSPATSGDFDVHQVYGELYLPLISGARGVEELSLELAARYSDYSTSGDVGNYKVSARYAPVEKFAFRAGWNTAVRAPSIAELFAPQGEAFPGANDPCAADDGVAGPIDPAIAAICAATGVPANVIDTPAINLAAGQVRTLSGGNPNLSQEEAETFTVGFVVTPSDNLSFSVDYFDIEIEDFIAAFGGGANEVLSTCYSTLPTGGVGSPFCDVVNRRADGTIDFVEIAQQNVAEQTLKGIDAQIEYSQELAGGLMSIKYIGTYTTESDFTAFAGAEAIECAGNFGQQCGDPLPDYKHRATFGWSRDRITAQLTWRLVGAVDDDDPDIEYTIEDIDTTHYFDAVGSYDFGGGFTATLGIDNLFDEQPPIIGDNQEQANTYPATYDVFGRTFFLRVGAQF